jgi:hypothetical protein
MGEMKQNECTRGIKEWKKRGKGRHETRYCPLKFNMSIQLVFVSFL